MTISDKVRHREPTLVTIVIPTYRRMALLSRAVQSVIQQTYPHWELVVSDDEMEEGETWAYLTRRAQEDDRIRPIKNKEANGQAENTNNALRRARGEWIKILHDDDLLKRDCLAELIDVVSRYQGDYQVACVTCGVERYVNGQPKPSRRRSGWPAVELIPQNQIHIAMYMGEDAGGAAPSQKMIHRSVLEEGICMEQPPGLHLLVDSWFNARIGECGDLIIYRKPLVEWHQGEHVSETDEWWKEGAEEELYRLRDLLWPLITESTALPPPALMHQMLALQRAVWRIWHGQWRIGMRLLGKVRDIRAVTEYIRWWWHNVSKGRFARGKRVRLEP